MAVNLKAPAALGMRTIWIEHDHDCARWQRARLCALSISRYKIVTKRYLRQSKKIKARDTMEHTAQTLIDAAFDDRDTIGLDTQGDIRDGVNKALAMLDAGEARVAEPTGNHKPAG